jgi:hypothetical protein
MSSLISSTMDPSQLNNITTIRERSSTGKGSKSLNIVEIQYLGTFPAIRIDIPSDVESEVSIRITPRKDRTNRRQVRPSRCQWIVFDDCQAYDKYEDYEDIVQGLSLLATPSQVVEQPLNHGFDNGPPPSQPDPNHFFQGFDDSHRHVTVPAPESPSISTASSISSPTSGSLFFLRPPPHLHATPPGTPQRPKTNVSPPPTPRLLKAPLTPPGTPGGLNHPPRINKPGHEHPRPIMIDPNVALLPPLPVACYSLDLNSNNSDAVVGFARKRFYVVIRGRQPGIYWDFWYVFLSISLNTS